MIRILSSHLEYVDAMITRDVHNYGCMSFAKVSVHPKYSPRRGLPPWQRRDSVRKTERGEELLETRLHVAFPPVSIPIHYGQEFQRVQFMNSLNNF